VIGMDLNAGLARLSLLWFLCVLALVSGMVVYAAWRWGR